MSTTYSVVCKKCKERVWVGQSNYLYAYPYIADFFHKHINHDLVFINDLVDNEEFEQYTEYEETLDNKS